MPPPPPPSKSYTLVFDSDSEDESESEVYRIRNATVAEREPVVLTAQVQRIEDRSANDSEKEEDEEDEEDKMSLLPTATLVDAAQTQTEKTSSVGKQPRANLIGDDDDDDDSSGCAAPAGEQQQMTKSQKKNKRRRKRKKNKCSNSEQEPIKSVSFEDSIQVREYRRAFGLTSVPGDGAWPLGMDLDNYVDSVVSLEQWEQDTQARLQDRWERVKQKSSDDVVRTMTHRPAGVQFKFDTRQWDYKVGVKNPLFRILCEDERRELLLESSNSQMSDDEASSESIYNKMVDNHQYNDVFTQTYVMHVRHDLEELRNFRTKDTATGCNCRKLTVYIPPKNGGGKRSQHRRLKPAKLVQELRKRGLYDDDVHPKKSREELEKFLHDAVESEPCCWGSDCFCIRNGINCQSDACSCWHDSHVHAKNGGDRTSFVDVEVIRSRCGSEQGMYAVDLDSIDEYRQKILYCQPCKL